MKDFQAKMLRKKCYANIDEAKTPGDSGDRDFVVSARDPNSKIIRDL